MQLERVVQQIKSACNINIDEVKAKFQKATEESRKNLRPDNPFRKLKGTYYADVSLDNKVNKAISDVQDNIVRALESEIKGKIVFMKPSDRGAVFVTEGSQTNRVKLSRLKVSDKLRNEVLRLATRYPSPPKSENRVRVVISNDPVDLLFKSTGQDWSSCEALTGGFSEGPYSDIKNNNAIAYFYLGNSDKPFGRFMLRWCETDGKVDVGVEKRWYASKEYSNFGAMMLEVLADIVEDKGYMDYKHCITPYVHEGWSDEMGGPRKMINYKPVKAGNLIELAHDPSISRNTAITLMDSGDESLIAALSENRGALEFDNIRSRLLNSDNAEIVCNAIRHAESISEEEVQKLLKKVMD